MMINTEAVSTKKSIIMFRVTRPEIRDALKNAARDDVRSVATMLEKIVGEWLTDRGYLAKESDGRTALAAGREHPTGPLKQNAPQ
jgi:hypothetical protein